MAKENEQQPSSIKHDVIGAAGDLSIQHFLAHTMEAAGLGRYSIGGVNTDTDLLGKRLPKHAVRISREFPDGPGSRLAFDRIASESSAFLQNIQAVYKPSETLVAEIATNHIRANVYGEIVERRQLYYVKPNAVQSDPVTHDFIMSKTSLPFEQELVKLLTAAQVEQYAITIAETQTEFDGKPLAERSIRVTRQFPNHEARSRFDDAQNYLTLYYREALDRKGLSGAVKDQLITDYLKKQAYEMIVYPPENPHAK